MLEWHEDLGEAEGLEKYYAQMSYKIGFYLFTLMVMLLIWQMTQHRLILPIGCIQKLVIAVEAQSNGRIVPLNKQLQTGDQVEILTGSGNVHVVIG